MIRAHVTGAVLVLIVAIVAFDAGTAEPLNPYTAPPMLALGSGMAAAGAHCAAPPPK
ncbi:conserved hypothetical protein [Roseovarius sp. EC-HK134]|jgi:hypothetical protein|uniref:Uncharacterized protein n=1 Tax=Roseovarius mucosus TaxID=215743 RepID=A0A1V0RJC2_9RHOB|nr:MULTISPECIES: hypothetical protein [Roseovarius]ARE81682.1 hypothetical protein ROSMUCSMR3_00171 [Roseovarius mucosus]AWZ21732.1 Hypothetical protein RAK1035_3024 [Roseovarius sp. AK1035]EDM31925.1 hypothetical protein RTM1035_08329 [Roseovarius sp. TM1035]MBW4975007.1 hypothetical protein [Roseovarius mucosus]VVT31145.1 conserved hypothetical protein [Roseovarius sp. EC-HK134]